MKVPEQVQVADQVIMGDPGPAGRFGPFGGRFVPEALVPACAGTGAGVPRRLGRRRTSGPDWTACSASTRAGPRRSAAHRGCRPNWACGCCSSARTWPTPAATRSTTWPAQALLARRLGKTALVAETGAGQHGVATATVAAHLGLGCTVYMGERDMARQELNVFRMELLGATVRPVSSGSRTLKDATTEALRHWVTTVDSTHYCIGSVMGPHPYPWLVREFQRVIGEEARAQCAARPDLRPSGRPDVVVACVGGGSNAAGTFAGFADTPARLVGVEAAGGAALSHGRRGVLHGFLSSFLQDEHGQVIEAESVSAGLDYPGVGPEHAYLAARGRAEYHTVTDEEAIAAAGLCARTEGILAALESAHAVAWVARAARAGDLPAGTSVLITMSGRGDKDAATLKELTRGAGA